MSAIDTTARSAMKLALEALEYIHEGANNQGPHTGISWRCVSNKAEPAITALREALADEALERMAENARELGLDYEPAPATKLREQEPVKWSSYEPDGTHHNKPAQSKQKPVTWLKAIDTPGGWGKFVEAKPNEKGARPVYTSPPAQRTWVGLTDEDIASLDLSAVTVKDAISDVRAVEAKLKEKNSG